MRPLVGTLLLLILAPPTALADDVAYLGYEHAGSMTCLAVGEDLGPRAASDGCSGPEETTPSGVAIAGLPWVATGVHAAGMEACVGVGGKGSAVAWSTECDSGLGLCVREDLPTCDLPLGTPDADVPLVGWAQERVEERLGGPEAYVDLPFVESFADHL